MNLIKFATSRWGASFFMNLCQVLPLPLAYRLGDLLAGRVQKKPDDPCLEAFRANIAVVHGWPTDDPRVESAVSKLLRNIAHSYVDLFKAVKGGSEKIIDTCVIDPSAVEALEKSVASGRGTIVVGAHMCGFDFGLLALKKFIPDIQLMGNPNPVGRIDHDRVVARSPVDVELAGDQLGRVAGAHMQSRLHDLSHGRVGLGPTGSASGSAVSFSVALHGMSPLHLYLVACSGPGRPSLGPPVPKCGVGLICAEAGKRRRRRPPDHSRLPGQRPTPRTGRRQ